MIRGTALALLAYSLLSWGDALVKSLGRTLNVFQIGFFTVAFGCLVVVLGKPRGLAWREALHIKRPWAVEARALAGLGAGLLGIYAFTRLPLSDAYALIFLAPLFVTIFSHLILKERIGGKRWLAIAAGFLGVLLVVRPGFAQPQLGHLAALGVAVLMATSVIILRTIAAHESRTAVLVVLMTNAFVFYTIALLIGPGLTVPARDDLLRLAMAGGCAATGQIVLLAAARLAPASQIAPAQYCQIIWATAIGALFFDEHPGALKLIGLLIISGAGLATLNRSQPLQPLVPKARD